MHENLRAAKRMLAITALDYIHSSAIFYSTGLKRFYPVLNFKNLHDMNLTVGFKTSYLLSVYDFLLYAFTKAVSLLH